MKKGRRKIYSEYHLDEHLVKCRLEVDKTRRYMSDIVLILSLSRLPSPIFTYTDRKKYVIISKVAYIVVRRVLSQKKQNRNEYEGEEEKSTNMTKTTTLLTSTFSSVFPLLLLLLLLLLVEMVFVAITVIVVFILRSSAYFDRFVLSHKRAYSTALDSLLLLLLNSIDM